MSILTSGILDRYIWKNLSDSGAYAATSSRGVVDQLLNLIEVFMYALAARAVANSPSLVAILWKAVDAMQIGVFTLWPKIVVSNFTGFVLSAKTLGFRWMALNFYSLSWREIQALAPAL